MAREDGQARDDNVTALPLLHDSLWPPGTTSADGNHDDAAPSDAASTDGDRQKLPGNAHNDAQASDDDDDDDDDDDFELELMDFDDDDDEDVSLLDLLAAPGGLVDRPCIGKDTIAHRTRTKLSLVDVPLDTLEACLPPDPMDVLLESAGGSAEDAQHEYQRFLASLLPRENAHQGNLSFLDEEDDEYRPGDDEEDEDEDEDEEDDGDEDNGSRATRGPHRRKVVKQSVRVSKKELSALLWDSTQIKVPPTFTHPPPASVALGTAASTQAMVSATASTVSSTTARVTTPKGTQLTGASAPGMQNQRDAAARHELQGTVTPVQCLQLASQMHKHMQLLLQTFHLLSIHSDAASERVTAQREECERMLRELADRGQSAQRCKSRLIAKFTSSVSQREAEDGTQIQQHGTREESSNTRRKNAEKATERIVQRRVTRSLTAAHAAMAHPSMFEVVGSQAVDTLTEAFRAGCTVNDRTRLLKEHLLELDKHILPRRKKKRRAPPRGKIVSNPFSPLEDRLLTHGVKRFGINEPTAWDSICEHLLPVKTPEMLRKRYRYLISNKKKVGAGEIKKYHNAFQARKTTTWMLEEDVRIARGMLAFRTVSRPFAKISKTFLPHRRRQVIRKRWQRLQRTLQTRVGAEAAADPSSVEFLSAGVVYLEEKVRNQVHQPPALASRQTPDPSCGRVGNVDTVTPAMSATSQIPSSHVAVSTDTDRDEEDDKARQASVCRQKYLHPALFYTSWAVINPSALLERTCEHNWPSFIEEKQQQDPLGDNSALDIVSQTAASLVEKQTAHIRHEGDALDDTTTAIIETSIAFGAANKTDQAVDTGRSGTSSTAEIATALTNATSDLDDADFSRAMEDEEDEGDEGKEEDDDDDDDFKEDVDSEFEREELLSSEAGDSDSEYEQLALSDDDESAMWEDDSSFATRPDTVGVEQMVGSALPVAAMVDSSNVISASQHPLRLENLSNPEDLRAQRALAALERRMTGTTQSGGTFTNTTSRRTKGVSTPRNGPRDGRKWAKAALLSPSPSPSEGAYPSPSSSSEGDGFERDELRGSSSEDSGSCSEMDESDSELENDTSGRNGHSNRRRDRGNSLRHRAGTQPPKRIKLHVRRCDNCGSSPCVCANDRMQHLLRRMAPRADE